MLILLPPSAGQCRDDAPGPSLEWAGLSHPELNADRRRVVAALEEVSARPDAAELLGVGPAVSDEVKGNIGLGGRATRPVSELYTGVLYGALGLASLSAPARRRSARNVLVFSAPWGVVHTTDLVPPHRLAIGVDLPGPGRLAAFWRARLGDVLAAELERAGGPVVDCRSTSYRAMWRLPPGAGASVRVVRERAGVRRVVSHLAKLTRGELARDLLEAPGPEPASLEEVRAVAARHPGWTAELAPATARTAAELTIVLSDPAA